MILKLPCQLYRVGSIESKLFCEILSGKEQIIASNMWFEQKIIACKCTSNFHYFKRSHQYLPMIGSFFIHLNFDCSNVKLNLLAALFFLIKN